MKFSIGKVVPRITVYLHTIYQIHSPDGPIHKLLINDNQVKNVRDVLEKTGVIYHPESTLLVLNRRIADLDEKVITGDELHVIPAISGG